MKWSMLGVAILVAAVWSGAVGAQSGGTMAKGDKMDKMQMMDTNYTGCIEAGSAAGTFALTHLVAADHMGKDMMKEDVMKNDTMAKDTKAMGSMSQSAMAPTTLTLTGSSVDLRKHVGHKVTVTGSLAHDKMDAMEKGTMDKATSTFTVKSLKMVAATCS
jgi:hypothetical protein